MAGKDIEFNLKANNTSPGGYEVTVKGDATFDPKTNAVTMPNGYYYVMRFNLLDTILSFDGDEDKVFMVIAGNACPERGQLTGNSNFDPKKMKIKDNGRQLEVRNNNVDPGTFAYRILIKDNNGVPHDFDPVIINGGGGENSFFGWLPLALGFGTGLVLMAVAHYTGLLARILG